jgi:predicted DNA-binding protein
MMKMPDNEMKGITVKVDAQLHAQVKEYIEAHGMTMSEFVAKALDSELHPSQTRGSVNMANRTLAFQVSEETFDRLKDYLSRHPGLTQKAFVLGLIEAELDRDMQQTNEVEQQPEDEDEDFDEDEEESMDMSM